MFIYAFCKSKVVKLLCGQFIAQSVSDWNILAEFVFNHSNHFAFVGYVLLMQYFGCLFLPLPAFFFFHTLSAP